MSVHYSDGTVTVHHGDCIEVLATLPDASVDSVVTDPPYGLEFMGRDWDAPWKTGNGFRRAENSADAGRESVFGRSSRTSPEYIAGKGFQQWCETWAAECLRVLKPGGHMVAFGGTRTFHRLTAGIEDAGFEIRDVMSWLYGSGFPKSRNIGPETGGEWDGWGTALKPAWEPIILARKPLAGTVAGNVLTHGTGALNIDACRVPMSDSDRAAIDAKHAGMDLDSYERASGVSLNLSVNPMPLKAAKGHEAGRFPANVLMDEEAGAALDEQTGIQKDGTAVNRNKDADTERPHTVYGGGWMNGTRPDITYGSGGGASRFFYSAKADNAERPVVDGVAHPTVKPLALMEWLIQLVTPPGGTVLEPFSGSGTTLEAAQYTGHRAIGIEKGDEYLPLIVHRLERTDPRVKAPKPLEVHPDQLDMLSMLGGIA
ncbi:DNA-methyltransferase [Brachybacterium alimentarium]|uniref:DNA-methyltransferase n=3 Tax=Brachybacterium alimentarium TaxID=47845 RepID=UPI000DF31792|nr:site-specific DNA-methyltransferase [Brachybacterium alimentarium]RCS81835.1 site-specific DNA-methyltransferase [Brachybacterium alimentarium]